MKPKLRRKKSSGLRSRQRRWEPIFRAAEEGRLPNRLKEVLEMSERLRRAGFKFDRPLNLQEAEQWLAEQGRGEGANRL